MGSIWHLPLPCPPLQVSPEPELCSPGEGAGVKYSSGREKLSVSWGEKGAAGDVGSPLVPLSGEGQTLPFPPSPSLRAGCTAHTVPAELLAGPEERGLQAGCTGIFWLLQDLRGEGCDRHGRLVRACRTGSTSQHFPAQSSEQRDRRVPTAPHGLVCVLTFQGCFNSQWSSLSPEPLKSHPIGIQTTTSDDSDGDSGG